MLGTSIHPLGKKKKLTTSCGDVNEVILLVEVF